jgi:predicted small lipoprotein YifL
VTLSHPGLRAGSRRRWIAGAAWLLAASVSFAACGKKGPPLAPLLKVPATPADTAARRVGNVADVQFRVAGANGDGTRPADITRVEVYGYTGEAPTPAEVVKYGTLVVKVPVRKPPARDEEAEAKDDEEDPDKPAKKAPPKPPPPPRPPASMVNGFDQGDLLVASEPLGPEQMTVVEPKRPKSAQRPVVEDPWQPRLTPAKGKGNARLYFVVGVNHRGQRGGFSAPLSVPLSPPPSAPSALEVAYTEKGIALSWQAPSDLPRPVQGPAPEGALPSTSRAVQGPNGGFNVYEVPPAPKAEGTEAAAPVPPVMAGSLAKPLNDKLLEETSFLVAGLEFGKARCFAVRAVAQSAAVSEESEASAPACITPKDTFPPAAPKSLSAVGSEGAISLIWEANSEADLAGYLVLRSEAGKPPQALTPQPIKETTFRDATVARGVRYLYTVVAVDTAGNRSAASNRVEETAR